jgi:hypothetical protein
MQIQHSTSQAFSQQSLVPQESEILFFEDAFDTESLRKFFQEHESHLNTPSTSCKNSCIPEEFDIPEPDSKSAFSSSFAMYLKNCSDKLPLASYSDSLELEESLDIQTPESLEKEPFIVRIPFDVAVLERQLMMQRMGGFAQGMESNKMEFFNGSNRISINASGKILPQGKIQKARTQTGQGRDSKSKKGEKSFDKRKGKKSVFIIERNVKPWMITKQPKEKMKIPSLTKKKSNQAPSTQTDTKILLENRKENSNK